MKRSAIKLSVRDEGAVRWRVASLLCFWLRYPHAYPTVMGAPEPALTSFLRYGDELRVLEHDLTECINEFRLAHEVLYHGPEMLELKKFAVVYHVDNFYVRIHKFVENVYGLLGQGVGLEPSRRLAPEEPPYRKQVRAALARRKLPAVLQCLREFEENTSIKRAVEARHLFVHRFREEPELPFLGPRDRFAASIDEDPLAQEIRCLYQASDLDRYARRKVRELSETLKAARDFRDRLFEVLDNATGGRRGMSAYVGPSGGRSAEK
jgi:hypothetical protein